MDSKTKAEYRKSRLAGVMSLHGSTAVTIDGRGFSSASPTSRLFAHFRLSGSDARWRAAKMAAVSSAHLGFKNALQKPTSDVTDNTSIFFTVYGFYTCAVRQI